MTDLYSDFDFSVLENPDFKEDSVREELILPLLKTLTYKPFGRNKIIRSKSISHPLVKIGSGKRNIRSVPDYLFEVNGEYAWVLDAKAPNEDIKSGEHLEQVYFYAIHPEIRVKYYALCNGREFLLQKIDEKTPSLYFHLEEIGQHWEQIEAFLSPDIFVQTSILNDTTPSYQKAVFDYDNLQLPKPMVVRKQAAKRHFGVHGYFTKQAWNVVQHYVKNFSKPGDTVLDSFGGTGVTLVEALILGRKAIHIDLNPLSKFIVENLITPINIDELNQAFERVLDLFEKNYPENKKEIQQALKKYPYPKGVRLPKGSDVEFVEELFSDKQLAELSLLKYCILKESDTVIRNTLLLMFSGLLNKVNLTYHASKGRSAGRGNSSVFAYYRYRIAKEPAFIEIKKYFRSRLKKITAAKKDIAPFITKKTIATATIIQGDATNLAEVAGDSIDYIYTDPPYGSKIAYLDLSTMWNSWLDLEVTDEDYEREAIEGGSLNKTSDEYSDLLAKSIQEMYRVLKYNRWMSFVFAHKDPKYWHLIVDTAEKAGFEYKGAVKQSNGQSSFKKRQNPFSVLSGQLIINFKKVKTPQAIQKVRLGADIYDLIIETIESVIAENDGAFLEQINDELIMKGLEFGFLDILSKEYKDLTPVLMEHFNYDEATETFHIRPNKKFKTTIPLDLRIRYFLISYLRRREQHKEYATTDEVILHVMPLLKNGITPENQTILKVLERIAEKRDENTWKLKEKGQMSLFN